MSLDPGHPTHQDFWSSFSKSPEAGFSKVFFRLWAMTEKARSSQTSVPDGLLLNTRVPTQPRAIRWSQGASPAAPEATQTGSSELRPRRKSVSGTPSEADREIQSILLNDPVEVTPETLPPWSPILRAPNPGVARQIRSPLMSPHSPHSPTSPIVGH